MTALTEEQVEDIKGIFQQYDKNQDGTMDAGELRGLMRELGQDPTEADLQKMIAEAEERTQASERNGKIEFSEFLDMIERQGYKSQEMQEQELEAAFKVFDKDNNGFITCEELKYTLCNLGEVMTEEEVTMMIQEADTDNNGVVNYQEFVKLMAAR